MKKIDNPEIPLSVNIIRFQSYLLNPDEVIFFDWLVVKSIHFGYDEFYYSQDRIENEIRIKRTRQDKIISSFSELGIINIAVKENRTTKGRVRYYFVDFEALCDKDVLSSIISPKSSLYANFVQYFKHHSSEQKKVQKKKPQENTADKQKVDNIYNLLNRVYEQRRNRYNKDKNKGLKSPIQLQRSKPLEKKLLRLNEKYDMNSIENSFLAYVDAVFNKEEEPNNLIRYFLAYDFDSDEWGVFGKYLNYFALNYSHSK